MSIFNDKSLKSVAEAAAKIMEASAKKADKDYDKDGKIESPKDEVWGSRLRAAKMAGKLKEEEQIDEAFPTVADGEKSLKAKEGKTSKGTLIKTKTGVRHERDYDDTPEPEEKRGRGRPTGSKSGAKKRLSEMRQEYLNYFEEVDNATFTKELEDQKAKFDGKKKGADVAKPAVQAVKQEEYEADDGALSEEQLDELSKSTVKSYVMKKMEKPTTTKKDVKGMTNAYNRLKGYKPTSEQVEQMDEVSPPGREDQVKALKKVPGIDNPYAVSWASYRKSHPKKD
jgi:hypothetical protein